MKVAVVQVMTVQVTIVMNPKGKDASLKRVKRRNLKRKRNEQRKMKRRLRKKKRTRKKRTMMNWFDGFELIIW